MVAQSLCGLFLLISCFAKRRLSPASVTSKKQLPPAITSNVAAVTRNWESESPAGMNTVFPLEFCEHYITSVVCRIFLSNAQHIKKSTYRSEWNRNPRTKFIWGRITSTNGRYGVTLFLNAQNIPTSASQ